MNRTVQALVLTAIGGLALRVGWTDEYLRYVNEWMRWPLVASGLLLVALAFTVVLWPSEERHPTTRAAWALLIPVVVGLVVQPPALGGYVAERGVNQVGATYDDAAGAPLVDGETSELLVSNFVVLAANRGEVLEEHTVRLTGFVTSDEDGWYVTRVRIRCCAADAAAYRVLAEGQEPPPDDRWVEATGTWVSGTGTTLADDDPPAIAIDDLTLIDEPQHPYE